MTIAELRKIYPSHDFYFFRNGIEIRSPFYHDHIESYEEHNGKNGPGYVFINMPKNAPGK